jgi:hypothetical protein
MVHDSFLVACQSLLWRIGNLEVIEIYYVTRHANAARYPQCDIIDAGWRRDIKTV